MTKTQQGYIFGASLMIVSIGVLVAAAYFAPRVIAQQNASPTTLLQEALKSSFGNFNSHTLYYKHLEMVQDTGLLDNNLPTGGKLEDIQLWAYGKAARLDIVSQDDSGQSRQIAILMGKDDQNRCLGTDQYYECEPAANPDMASFLANGRLDIQPKIITKPNITERYLQWAQSKTVTGEMTIDFSRKDIGYSDAGSAVNLADGLYTVDLSYDPAAPDADDLNPNTMQFQIHNGTQYSPVYVVNLTTNLITQLSWENVLAAQQQYQQQLHKQYSERPDFLPQFMQGIFDRPEFLQSPAPSIQPVSQQTLQWNNHTVVELRYKVEPDQAGPLAQARFIQYVINPQTVQVEAITVFNDKLQIIRQVTIVEDKVLNNIDPAQFFTEQYWKNELHLTSKPPHSDYDLPN